MRVCTEVNVNCVGVRTLLSTTVYDYRLVWGSTNINYYYYGIYLKIIMYVVRTHYAQEVRITNVRMKYAAYSDMYVIRFLCNLKVEKRCVKVTLDQIAVISVYATVMLYKHII